MRLIDADELKKKFSERSYWTYTHEHGDAIPIGWIMSGIDHAPTVEPFEPDYVGAERLAARQRGYADGYRNGMKIGKTLNPRIKQGEWISRSGGYYKCDKCGEVERAEKNYCPNCGAKMEAGDRWKEEET